MHLANSGRVIIKLSSVIKEGQLLCNESSQKIAKVTELIGPVKDPYASAIPLTNNLKKLNGMKVFSFEQTSPAKRKKQEKT
jgi:RNA-binding protein